MNNQEKPWHGTKPSGRILRPKEVFWRAGISRAQGYEMIRKGEFPPFIKISDRAVGMPEAWLDAFIAHRVKCSEVQS